MVSEVDGGFLSLGHMTARAAALRAAGGGRLQRTLLVHGPAGAGKGAFVDDLLALLFCTDPDVSSRPCNACRGCRDARGRRHPDLVVGSPERWRDDRSTGESIVSAARRWLLESAGAPVASEVRVVLVEGADRANEQIQNALLKALEEPSPRQMFILVADEPSRVLPTIRSRAQSLRIGSVPHGELVAWLVDRERLPADQADALARIAGGLPGRAIGFARNPALVDWRRRTQDQLLELLGRGRADRFGSVRDLLDEAGRLGLTDEADDPSEGAQRPVPAVQRAAAQLIVDAWLGLTRDLLLTSVGRSDLAPSAQLVPGVRSAADRLSPAPLLAFVELLEQIAAGLYENAAPRLALEVAMLAWPTPFAGGATNR
jgi:DNA polymerase III delta prime subunit